MHSFEYQHGRLHCEGADLVQIADRIGTPAYVYSAGTIVDHYRRLSEAFIDIPHLICYAVKANSNIGILALLGAEGSGFDIVSAGELHRVLKAGGRADHCTFAGVGKTDDEIVYAIEAGILAFNVESESELLRLSEIASRLGKSAPISLRVNPDVDADTHKYISTGKSENKFGIAYDRILAVYEQASKLPGITIRGVQMHIGSQITRTGPFAEAVEKMAPLVEELKARYQIEYFSVGGGIGIVYDPALESGSPGWWQQEKEANRLTIASYAEAILPTLRRLGLKIIFEPGRYMVGNSGVLITRVLHLKQGGSKQFAIVDAGMNDLIRPALYESYHEIVPLEQAAAGALPQKYDIVGPVCESGDFFAQDRELPPLRPGDLIALMSAGAYGFTMASNYNSRPTPAEVLVHDGETTVIRARQTLDDLTRGEIIPDWVTTSNRS